METVYEARQGVSPKKAVVYNVKDGYKVTGYTIRIGLRRTKWQPTDRRVYKELGKAKRCATMFAITGDLLNEDDVDKVWQDLGIKALL